MKYVGKRLLQEHDIRAKDIRSDAARLNPKDGRRLHNTLRVDAPLDFLWDVFNVRRVVEDSLAKPVKIVGVAWEAQLPPDVQVVGRAAGGGHVFLFPRKEVLQIQDKEACLTGEKVFEIRSH